MIFLTYGDDTTGYIFITVRDHITLTRVAEVKGLAIPNVGWNTHTLLTGIQNDGTTSGNTLAASGKVKYRLTIWPRKKICPQKPIHKCIAFWPVIINIINDPYALQ